MTSLLRDEMPLPMAAPASATMTSAPVSAAARATASPTTPAPTTKTCIERGPHRSAMDRGVRAFSSKKLALAPAGLEAEFPSEFALDQGYRSDLLIDKRAFMSRRFISGSMDHIYIVMAA